MRQRPEAGRATLHRRGAELGRWLFNEPARWLLKELKQRRGEADPRIKIGIRSTRPWHIEFPWEIALPATLRNHIGVDPDFVVVRTSDQGLRDFKPVSGGLNVHLWAVDEGGDCAAGRNLEEIRESLRELEDDGTLMLRAEFRGQWEDFLAATGSGLVPDVWQFLGRCSADGKGLVFQSASESLRPVMSEQIAHLPTRQGSRHTLLVVLCAGGAGGAAEQCQPYSTIAMQLIRHGIPMVISLQTPALGDEAARLSSAFYSRC